MKTFLKGMLRALLAGVPAQMLPQGFELRSGRLAKVNSDGRRWGLYVMAVAEDKPADDDEEPEATD